MISNSIQKVMVTNQFGSPIYIAPLKDGQIQITENIEDASVWTEMDSDSKLKYHSVVTGYELEWQSLN